MRTGRVTLRGPAAAVPILLGVALALAAAALTAQDAPTRLSLDEAIRLARSNNPGYLSTQNDLGSAKWGEREAYAAFLPSAMASGFASYQKAGVQRLGTVEFAQSTDWYQSSYRLGLTWSLDGSTIFGVPAARATKRATEARIDAAAFDLESGVTLQYMSALRGRDGVEVARRGLERAQQNLRIVRARVETGAAAGTDGKQAEVDEGRAEVALIQAELLEREAVLLLAEQLGVTLPDSVELVSQFEIFEPMWDRDSLIEQAFSGHPTLKQFRAQESASRASARQTVTSQYLPSFTVSTAISGNAQEALNQDFLIGQAEGQVESQREGCESMNDLSARLTSPLPGYPRNCAGFVLTEDERREILASNNVFPFNFDRNPLSLSLQVSIPVFNGFSRERSVAEANQAADDAENDRRAEELRLNTAVTQAFDNLSAAYRIVQLEEVNRALADEQLRAQQRRYAIGSVALLELLDAQQTLSTADQAYLNALYDFHWNLIRLEAAVGQPLRPE